MSQLPTREEVAAGVLWQEANYGIERIHEEELQRLRNIEKAARRATETWAEFSEEPDGMGILFEDMNNLWDLTHQGEWAIPPAEGYPHD